MEEEKKHLEFMANMRQYDPDPPADDENAKDRPKDDPIDLSLFPDDDAEERNSKCMLRTYFSLLLSRSRFISDYFLFLSNQASDSL